jgi:hypothetical protein
LAIKDLKLADPIASIFTAGGIRAGHVSVTSLLTSVAVSFSSALPDANYEILLFMSGVAVSFSISSKVTTGFTIGFSVGLSGDITYLAVPSI